jgi:hypothetical protein
MSDGPIQKSWASLTPPLIVVFFLFLWSALAHGGLRPGDQILVLIFLTVWCWGRALARWGGLDRLVTVDLPMVLLLGMTWTGSVLSLARWFGPWELEVLFKGLLVTGAFIEFIANAWTWWFGRKNRAARDGLMATPAGAYATFLSFAAATAWVQHYLPPLVSVGDEVIVKPIRDNFMHTHQVTLLAYPGPMTELGRYGLAGEPVPFYHYASYVFPAILNTAGGQTAFETTLSLWLPLGLAAVGLAAYTLGSIWFSSRWGLWGVVAVLVLPDPTYWTFGLFPLGTYIYSFHRFLQLAPANAYAVAVAGLAVTLLSIGYRHRSMAAVLMGMAVGGSSLLFKAQVFMAAFPLCLLLGGGIVWVRWGELMGRRWKWSPAIWIGLVMLVAGIACVLPATPLWERSPRIGLEWPPGKRLAEFFINRSLDDPPALALAERGADGKGAGGISLRVAMVLFMTFRWWLLLLGAAFFGLFWTREFRWIHGVAGLALAIYLGFALFLAPNLTGYAFGNPWDLQFVPYCWVYFLLLVWGVGVAGGLHDRWASPSLRLPLLGTVLCLLVPIVMGKSDTDDWQTDERWAYLTVDQGLIESAAFIRTHSDASDLMQDSQNDPYYVVESLCERRAYAGWPVVGSYTARDPSDPIFRERLVALEKWRGARTTAEVVRFAREAKIRWFLLHPETAIDWPEEILSRPVFESHGYRVYDLSPAIFSKLIHPADAAP